MSLHSIEEMLERVRKSGKELWEIILEEDVKERRTTVEESKNQMVHLWHMMLAASEHYEGNRQSASGLSGGDGAKMLQAIESGQTMVDAFMGQVIAEALKMGECNACMKRIVAAPTAGSCGVLPAVLIPSAMRYQLPEEDLLKALYVSAGFGLVIASRASISGAEGGCQAEIGSASGMAAAALVTLRGGNPEMCAHACAIALKSVLGLVCDPVAGLVEVPCVKRNVMGAVNAVTAADMALAGITSKIPVDEVIDAMRAIGNMMPSSLRETGEAGLAATPTGKSYRERI